MYYYNIDSDRSLRYIGRYDSDEAMREATRHLEQRGLRIIRSATAIEEV